MRKNPDKQTNKSTFYSKLTFYNVIDDCLFEMGSYDQWMDCIIQNTNRTLHNTYTMYQAFCTTDPQWNTFWIVERRALYCVFLAIIPSHNLIFRYQALLQKELSKYHATAGAPSEVNYVSVIFLNCVIFKSSRHGLSWHSPTKTQK